MYTLFLFEFCGYICNSLLHGERGVPEAIKRLFNLPESYETANSEPAMKYSKAAREICVSLKFCAEDALQMV